MLLNQKHIPIMPRIVLGMMHFFCSGDYNFFNLFVCSPAELPRLEVGMAMKPVHYSAPPCVSHNGFLFKTASMARAITERKAREGN